MKEACLLGEVMKDCMACEDARTNHKPQDLPGLPDTADRLFHVVLLVGGMFITKVGLSIGVDNAGVLAVLAGMMLSLVAGCLVLYTIVLGVLHARAWVREHAVGHYLYHYIALDGEYHCHLYSPQVVMGERDRVTFLCKVAHGGWFKRSEILSHDAKTRLWWEITWASPLWGIDNECWLKIQSVQNTFAGTPWPSTMCVHAEQALRVMQHYGSAHGFVEKAVGVIWHEKPGLERSLGQVQRELDSEEERVKAMAKSVIRMLTMFDAMKTTIGRTKHAQALKQPLQDMLKMVGDDDLVHELETEVVNELIAEQHTSPNQ